MIGHGGLKDTLETLRVPQVVVETSCPVIRMLFDSSVLYACQEMKIRLPMVLGHVHDRVNISGFPSQP